MRSPELGRLFEVATSKILHELFNYWGFITVDQKIQASGTQYGFDIFYRIATEHISLNIFVECKASLVYNTIDARELTRKVEQLSWAGFPHKDIHLFLSPSRSIKFDNDLLTIEDDSHPFVIIDWMRKEGEISPVAELFAAYRDYGSDEDILKFCDFLFSEIDSEFRPSRTFGEVCTQLKQSFDRRIAEHNAKIKYKDYRIINGAFWSQIRQETQFEYLHYYYTKTDSTPARLREAVANDLYVRNYPSENAFERNLKAAITQRAALIKILSKGGEGKSTFLYHIAKTYCHDNLVIWLEDIGPDVLADIEQQIHRLETDCPIIFLLDNAAVYGRSLTEFAQKLTTGFRKNQFVLVIAEREFRYQYAEDVQEFEAVFNEIFLVHYRSDEIRNEVVDRFISYLQMSGAIVAHHGDEVRNVFLDDRRKSLTECVFSVIRHLKVTYGLKGYKFDWEDWNDFTTHHAPALQRLYLIVSTFYQFGYSLDLTFCASLLKGADVIDINIALRDNPNLPIYRRGQHLLLRHETIASWYLDGTTEETRINQRNSEEIFRAFLANINSPFTRNIFIWLCIKNRDFRRSYLAKCLDDETRVSILERFIVEHPLELKCRTELSKVYQQQKRWKEAEDVLRQSLQLDPENRQARTELSKIYQQQKRWKEAEDVLKELLQLDSENRPARTELSRIYQQQKRWKEAEEILLESLQIDREQLHPRTELSKIYQQQKRWKEAEDILLESLGIDAEQLHPRTELSRVYQQQKRWKEAEDVLLESLRIDHEQLHPRTELSRVYQQQKRWKEAEDILLELLRLNPLDLQGRTELSKVYQQQKRWKEAEAVLLESLRIDPEQLHPRTELSRIYQKQKKWPDAIRMLKEYIEIDPEGLHPRTELSKIYQKQKRWKEAEDILLESLEINHEQLHSRTELSRIYQQQKRWKEAEDILLELLRLDAHDLLARTELSKIYQKHGKWKEAEDLLTECLAIDSDDVNSLLELGRVCSRDPDRLNQAEQLFHRLLEVEPNSLFAKIELANLYRKLRWFGPRETLLFEIYKTDPDDLPTLMGLADVFRRFRKYRIALKLLENALALRSHDLITISELIRTHQILRSNEQARHYYLKGAGIMKADAYNKHSDRFGRIDLRLDDEFTLLNLNEIGVCVREDDRRYIESNETRYLIDEQTTVNSKIKLGDTVFFATYRKNGEVVADFVEPYFESLDDLHSLK